MDVIFGLLCEANKRLSRPACGTVSLIDFPWAQLEIQTQNNWRHCWACPQVRVERGSTGRWLCSMWSLSMFWGFIGKESDLYGRKPQLLGVIFIGSETFGSCSRVCSVLFLSRSLHSLWASLLGDHSLSIPPQRPVSVAVWASSKDVPSDEWALFKAVPESHCIRVNTVTSRLSACWSLCQHSLQLLWTAWSAMLWLLIFINL